MSYVQIIIRVTVIKVISFVRGVEYCARASSVQELPLLQLRLDIGQRRLGSVPPLPLREGETEGEVGSWVRSRLCKCVVVVVVGGGGGGRYGREELGHGKLNPMHH